MELEDTSQMPIGDGEGAGERRDGEGPVSRVHCDRLERLAVQQRLAGRASRDAMREGLVEKTGEKTGRGETEGGEAGGVGREPGIESCVHCSEKNGTEGRRSVRHHDSCAKGLCHSRGQRRLRRPHLELEPRSPVGGTQFEELTVRGDDEITGSEAAGNSSVRRLHVPVDDQDGEKDSRSGHPFEACRRVPDPGGPEARSGDLVRDQVGRPVA
ncbi:hypothetical protein MT349_06870 [Rathayibacter caricis]|uniref:hypothetical protein n=1 Tax=Rathayibacter caricis TaxID=110936 RepID=UPI001FB51665|nr:hypothetical protein [Rathayibacter caricis]MCJ1695499.1 hypothetical protein [Rathayibacter caricis]